MTIFIDCDQFVVGFELSKVLDYLSRSEVKAVTYHGNLANVTAQFETLAARDEYREWVRKEIRTKRWLDRLKQLLKGA